MPAKPTVPGPGPGAQSPHIKLTSCRIPACVGRQVDIEYVTREYCIQTEEPRELENVSMVLPISAN